MVILKKPTQEMKTLLITAQKNLDSAVRDYDAEDYTDAISSLTQSIEKGSKSFFGYFNIVPENELAKKIRHTPTKGFKKSVKDVDKKYAEFEKQISELYLNDSEKIPKFDIASIKSEREKLINALSIISNNPSKFKNISKENMEKFILAIKNIQNKVEKSRRRISSDSKYLQNIDDFIDNAFKILERQKMKNEIIQMVKFACIIFYDSLEGLFEIEDKAVIFHNVVNITVTMVFLSIITQPHAVLSRYPPSPDYYSKNHLIVKKFPIICKLAKNALNSLEEIFEINEKFAKKSNSID